MRNLSAAPRPAPSTMSPSTATVRRYLRADSARRARHQTLDGARPRAVDLLVRSVQDLSLATDAEQVQRIVRTAARRLLCADGATFVLRDGDECFYVAEDAVAPLWQGQRFPLEACISGWSMLHGEQAVVDDVYADPRTPHEAYRRTFVTSLVMTPVRRAEPVGAIGMYWARRRRPTAQELELARALADSTAIALQHVATLGELDRHRRAERRGRVASAA